MKHAPLSRAARMLTASALVLAAPAALANDYPTIERVLYVERCMEQHRGPIFEMRNKCACTIDKLASQVPFAQYETMSTAADAFSIGGERGSYIRDTKVLTDEIKRFRELQTAAKKSCFINVEAR